MLAHPYFPSSSLSHQLQAVPSSTLSFSFSPQHHFRPLFLDRHAAAALFLRYRRRKRWWRSDNNRLRSASGAGDGDILPDFDEPRSSVSTLGEGQIGNLIRMLGLENDPSDREISIITLYNFSRGGKECIDRIMRYPGCINLVLNLLKSESRLSCEAATGLLRNLTEFKMYRDLVFEAGAVQEVLRLICRPDLSDEVKEQSLFTLWNISNDEEYRARIAETDLLLKIICFLDEEEEIKVQESACGIIANLASSPCYHSTLIDAGVIPKLAGLLTSKEEGYTMIRKESRAGLLQLFKDPFYKILIMEQGLVRVPLIGFEAYESFKPVTHSWPTFPDGTKIPINPKENPKNLPNSKFGASSLLIGLNISDQNELNVDQGKLDAITGRSRQQFLVRMGMIELEETEAGDARNDGFTLLPWIDGVARLSLILELDDLSGIVRAAHAIGVAAVNEFMRVCFKEAGAVWKLVPLLSHGDVNVREAVAFALDQLSVSKVICEVIEEKDGVDTLLSIIKDPNSSESLLEKSVSILSRIFETHCSSQGKLCKTERKESVDSVVISRLISILNGASPIIQTKVFSILEYLANFEHVTEIATSGIGSVLHSIFQKGSLDDGGEYLDTQIELTPVQIEDTGIAMSAAAKFLLKLLDCEQFSLTVNPSNYISLLRKNLKSKHIPLHTKDWIAACLVKLESKFGSNRNDINDGSVDIELEITIYKTIPRLIDQIRTSFSNEIKRDAISELKGIISKGIVDYSKAVANNGGIFELVRLIEEEGSEDLVEGSLVILYNLSMDEENQPAFIGSGSVPVLKRIVLSGGAQWELALRLLRTLPV